MGVWENKVFSVKIQVQKLMKENNLSCIALHILAVVVVCNTNVWCTVTVYPTPDNLPVSYLSSDYQVWVNDVSVPVYSSYRFDGDSTTTLWGRPVSPVSFCSFDSDQKVTVKIKLGADLKNAGIDTGKITVRPLRERIEPTLTNDTFVFTIDKQPCQLTVEAGAGLKRPLHIFINPIETDIPTASSPSVLYFGPGYHIVDTLTIRSDSTVYLAGGAVIEAKYIANKPVAGNLYGKPWTGGINVFNANNTSNATIRGRGIITCRHALENGQRSSAITCDYADNLTIEGVIITISGWAGLHIRQCEKVTIDNVKMITPWVNGDALALDTTTASTVKNCFAHCADDGFEIKVRGGKPVEDVVFSRCTIWSDLGAGFGLIAESEADSRNITFRDCTVLHSTDNISSSPVIGLKIASGSGNARDYTFENIVVEETLGDKRPILKVINNWPEWHLDVPTESNNPYAILNAVPRTPTPGLIENITFRNINVLKAANTDIVVMADSIDSPIRDIMFNDVIINGNKIMANDERITLLSKISS